MRSTLSATRVAAAAAAGARSTPRAISRLPRAGLSTSVPQKSGSDYGGGNDAPKGQRPSDLSNEPNPSENIEHPGPPSPAAGKNEAKPTLHNEQRSLDEEHTDEDVKRHNEESKGRLDRSPGGADEKVDKGYWKQGQ